MKMSVEYDLVSAEDRTIYVPVFVRSQVYTPPLAIPKGTWKVIWQLDPDSLQYAKFIYPGIEKQDSNSVPQLIIEDNWVGIDQDHCAARLINRAEEPDSCSMYLCLVGSQGTFKHDPTIAVTKDPLDPPTSPPRRER